MMERTVTLFPLPDSPTSPSVSPPPEVEAHAGDRVADASRREEIDPQIADREDDLPCLRRSASDRCLGTVY